MGPVLLWTTQVEEIAWVLAIPRRFRRLNRGFLLAVVSHGGEGIADELWGVPEVLWWKLKVVVGVEVGTARNWSSAVVASRPCRFQALRGGFGNSWLLVKWRVGRGKLRHGLLVGGWCFVVGFGRRRGCVRVVSWQMRLCDGRWDLSVSVVGFSRLRDGREGVLQMVCRE